MAIINAIPASFWKRVRKTVASGATVDVDTVPFAAFKSSKYFVTISNTANNKYKSVEVWVSRQGSTVVDSVYAKLGDSLDVELTWTIVLTDVKFQVTNNELFTVDVLVTKLI